MTEPPQDGYGSPRYRGQRPPPPSVPQQPPPQQLQPRQPPPQPPTAGFGYWDSATQQLPPQPPPQPPLPPPQQPSWQPTPPQPYDQESPGIRLGGPLFADEQPTAYDYAPIGPQQATRSKTKLMVLLAGTILAMLLAASGVYYMVDGQGGGGASGAAPPASDAPPEAGSKPGGGNEGKDSGKDSGNDGNDGKNRGQSAADEAGDAPGRAARDGGFKGRWQGDGGKKLTIGGKVRSGQAAGKNSVSYTDPRGEGSCFGIGDERRSGSVFRMALQCGDAQDKRYVAGNSTRTDDRLTVEWDAGSRETLTWAGD